MSDIEKSPRILCRRRARQVWRERPQTTLNEMLALPEIIDTCRDIKVDRLQLENWVLPDLSSHEELEYFRQLPSWRVEEAVALWLDLNPFIMIPASEGGPNSEFWRAAYAPDLRRRFYDLRELAQRAAIAGNLAAHELGGVFYVAPRDFAQWAAENSSVPCKDTTKEIFAESKQESQALTMVEKKILKIREILSKLEAADPDFDRKSMPGRKIDFQLMCSQLDKQMFTVSPDTFNDYLTGVCRFRQGARETNYYDKILPRLG